MAATTPDETATASPAANAKAPSAAHARVKIIAPDPSILRKQTKYNTKRNTPPTSLFMQRSAALTPTDYSYNQPPSSAPPEQAPDDSGYDSVFSNASTNDYQDPVYDDSSIAADYLREVRVQRIAVPTEDHNYIAPSAASPTPAIRVQRHTSPPPSPPHQHNLPLVPNVDSDDNSPYPVLSRTPSPPSPAYCRTSPIEPDDNHLTTDNEPRPAYDNETRETISHPIDAYFDYSEPEYDSEASQNSVLGTFVFVHGIRGIITKN